MISTARPRSIFAHTMGLVALLALPTLAFAQEAQSPFLTGATALQTNILAWMTPIAIILVTRTAATSNTRKFCCHRIWTTPEHDLTGQRIAASCGTPSSAPSHGPMHESPANMSWLCHMR